jgi:hypothetical protein
MYDGDNVGSDELSHEEFVAAQHNDDLLVELNKVVSARDEAKAFLYTDLGQSIRALLSAKKFAAMKACAEALDDASTEKAKYDYKVVSQVESIFAIIIVDGDEALTQLKQLLNN